MARGDDLAGYLPRVGAALLDGLVIGVVVVVLARVAAAAGAGEDSAGTIVIVSAVLSSLLYGPLLLCRKGEHNGQTLGKQVVGIRVVREDAEPIAAPVALLREFVGKGLLGMIPVYSFVDYLLPLGDPRSQAIHDKVANTFVVRADAVPDLGHREGQPLPPGAPAGWAPPTSSTPEASPPPSAPAAAGWAPPASPAPPTTREPVDLSAWARPPAAQEPAPEAERPPEPDLAPEPPAPAEDTSFAPPAASPPREPEDDEPVRGPFGPS